MGGAFFLCLCMHRLSYKGIYDRIFVYNNLDELFYIRKDESNELEKYVYRQDLNCR